MQWYHLQVLQGSLSGFILVGGKSLRMGRNKALLPYDGGALCQHIAAEAGKLASPICFVGDPGTYRMLGLPVVPDAVLDRGPLSGIEAALFSEYASEWNLIVACDLPRISSGLFRNLVGQIDVGQIETGADCIVPRSASGKLEPLCALYKKSCGPVIRGALATGTRRVVDAVAMLQAKFWPFDDAGLFQNVNTAPEWDRFLNDR